MNNYNYGQSYYQPQQMYQSNYQQPSYGFAFVNGIEEAKTFIVNPNCSYFLRDRNSSMCFEKKADNQGRWSLKIYNLVEQDTNAEFKSSIAKLEDKVNALTDLVQKLTSKGAEVNEQ